MTASSQKMRKPETLSAYLVSAGYGRVRATLHKYVETRPAEIVDKKTKALTTIWEHLYRCEETGEIRRWGYEYRLQVTN